MKEKCVQNVINLFIGLLTKRMTRLPKLNSMNSPRGCIVVRLTKASKHEPEKKMRKKDAASQFKLEWTQALSAVYLMNMSWSECKVQIR